MMRWVRQHADGWSASQPVIPASFTSDTLADPSTKKSKLPTGWPSTSVLSFGRRFNGTKPHTSRPVRASIASRKPRLVPTQISVRRSLLAAANPGYESSGGGSSDGGFKNAGVESAGVPSDRLRTALITVAASAAVRPIIGASAATFAVESAIIVPVGVAVKRLRLSGSLGVAAIHNGVPSALNFHPDCCVESTTGL